jgi:hypothetical protein
MSTAETAQLPKMTESRRTVLVTAAGIANGNNLILSLRRGGLDVRIVGTNADAAFLAKSTADVSLLLPPASHPQYREQAARVVEEHGVDVFIATNDKEVERVSRDRAGARLRRGPSRRRWSAVPSGTPRPGCASRSSAAPGRCCRRRFRTRPGHSNGFGF